MPRMNLLRFGLCSATALCALSIGEPAQSQAFANMYGEIIVIQNRIPSYLPLRDREGEKLEAEVRLLGQDALKRAKLLNDPEYVRYLTGKWRLFPSPKDGKKGEYCSAFFSREGVILTMSGPGGDYRGALLQFMSADIPRPKTQEAVQVTLTQNNVPPIKFKALNQSSPGLPFGSIIVPITTMDELLTGMEDVQSLDLQMNGKSIAKIRWHSGLAVRDELRKCLSGKPYTVTQIDLMGK
jgi:hypothetical protein